MKAEDKVRLFNAVTAYDKAQKKRPGYNPYALGHYAKGLTNIGRHVEAGHSLRDAIITEFNGRLADRLLKAVGLELMTKEEARYGLAKKLPELPDEDEEEAEANDDPNYADYK